MKKFKFFLLMAFFITLISCTHSCAQDDQELEETLKQLKPYACFTNPRFAELPTEEDINRLESALLQPGFKLPSSLKKYHLTLGNLIFSGVKIPTVHSVEVSGKYRSNLLDLIREGHEKGIPYKMPEVWIPFAHDSEEYICMNLRTESVCYFSIIPRLKKDKEEYPNLSVWLKEMFFPK
jgi:hypothetical protein